MTSQNGRDPPILDQTIAIWPGDYAQSRHNFVESNHETSEMFVAVNVCADYVNPNISNKFLSQSIGENIFIDLKLTWLHRIASLQAIV